MSAAPLPGPELPLSDLIRDAYAAELRAGRSGRADGPRKYVYASQRRACVRRMALDLMHPEDAPEFSSDTLARVEAGKDRESALLIRLARAGNRAAVPFAVEEQQRRFEIPDRDGELLIVGKVDARLRFSDGRRVWAEIKSGDTARSIQSADDVERSPWSRHWPDQLLAYLYASSEPVGLLILDRPGIPLILEYHLEDHLDRAEGFLRDARAAVDARFGRAPLPPITEDRGECRRCDHCGRSCVPDRSFGAGVQMFTDERLIELAEVRERTREARMEYEEADMELKSALRGVEHGLLGPFEVRGRWQKKTTVNVPNETKAKYTTVDPKGSFRLEIERV